MLVTLATLPIALTLPPEDWPQWRGPDGDNVSKESAWSPSGAEGPLWRASIGMGYSTPVIAAGRLIVTGYEPDGATPHRGMDRVSCLDATSGELLWSTAYPAEAYDNEHAGGTLATPGIFDGTVFVPTRSGEVRALALADGAVRWMVDLVQRHAVAPGRYGFASSPFLIGDSVVLNAGRTVALDRATGETLWISEDHDANYSTVAPIRLGERAGLCVFGGTGLAVIDAADGSEIASYVFRTGPRNVEGATPIVMGTRVFVSSAYDQGAALVDFAGGTAVEVWRSRAMRSKLAGCTLAGGFLYGFDESILKCLDLEGRERWRVRGLGQGALSVAGERLLVTTSEGELIVARLSPVEFTELSRAPVAEAGVFWATPVLANGLVYVRGSLGDLVCLDHRATSTAAEPRPEEPVAATLASALPAPLELERRHLEAAGFAAHPPGDLRMTGRVQSKALGLEDVLGEWDSAADGRLHVRVGLPPAIPGFIDRTFDGRVAWEKSPLRGEVLMKPEECAELVRTRGHRVLFDPVPEGLEAVTVGRETFHGTPCLRVDVRLTSELARAVYFDQATGLLAGHTCAQEQTVLFADWRAAGDVRLPFARTSFEADTGLELRWRFTAVEPPVIESLSFEVPESLREASTPGGR